jgi:uncharacterized protein YbjT (DUF2867 family)
MSRSALLIGGSGLVGRHVLEKILASSAYGRLVSVGRRRIPASHTKLEQIVTDMGEFTRSQVTGDIDDAYCCLGSTIKAAGSREAFRKIDFDTILRSARIAQDAGAKRFLLISSSGAAAKSLIFYLRVKGETEEAIQKLNFQATAILRPAGLSGERTTPRPAERVGTFIMNALKPLLMGPLRKYRMIAATDVAEAMVRLGLSQQLGPRILESDAIQALADSPNP